jgi:hypothetical protein
VEASIEDLADEVRRPVHHLGLAVEALGGDDVAYDLCDGRMFANELASALMVTRAFSAQRQAAYFASLMETSRPTLPVWGSRPSLKGSWLAVKRRIPERVGDVEAGGLGDGGGFVAQATQPVFRPFGHLVLRSTPLRTRLGRRARGSSARRGTRRR